ncbi:MAG: prepilin-type N-terminal cleavage/methylation domain-containing protein [Lachnospiraceae bacterium]|nr:prepilin-type N-terminal cleavage/methylation domain-containing protein [Lachnospiraceae bacterium]
MVVKEQSGTRSNRGYSLIELIVTVLISSVVMLAVVGFLTTGLNHYRSVNSETLLQMESQMTELFLTELFQEATDFQTVPASDYPAGKDVKSAVEVKRDGLTYMVALIGSELRFGEVTAGTMAEELAELAGKGKGETFLAQYVTSFSLASGGESFANALGNSYVGTMIDVTYQVDQKSYSSSSLITLRNRVKN